MSRTGRPKIENPKEKQLGVRLNRDELKRLDTVAEHYNESRASSFRRGIEKLYDELMTCTKDKEC